MTLYHVLRKVTATEAIDDGGTREVEAWDLVDSATASGTRQAIRAVLAETPELGAGEYVAVPARSFVPETVGVKSEPRVKFGG